MTQFSLNNSSHQVPGSKSDFASLVERIAQSHTGLKERTVCYFLEARKAGAQPYYVASIAAEGKFGTLHLLFEAVGRPDFSAAGFLNQTLSSQQVESLLSAFTPFLSESASHANVAFLIRAKEEGATVKVGFINQATDELKSNSQYVSFRTNALFNLFNEGALTGLNGLARKAILDSFGFLPNQELSAEGTFLTVGGERSTIRSAPALALGSAAVGGIDKFPSLLSVRSERLKQDGNRIVPSVMIRDGVHVGKRNIFMFHAAVNIAAFIGDDNMIDSHASIASAAQIGSKNKIGSFVSFEGVLSPANAAPVVIGDENFIGSFARIGTGITLGNKNFIGAGVNISKGTKLKDCRQGSSSKGAYINVQELNGAFNDLVIAPNNAVRAFNEVNLTPGEYILFENTPEFMARFEGDDRIKAKA